MLQAHLETKISSTSFVPALRAQQPMLAVLAYKSRRSSPIRTRIRKSKRYYVLAVKRINVQTPPSDGYRNIVPPGPAITKPFQGFPFPSLSNGPLFATVLSSSSGRGQAQRVHDTFKLIASPRLAFQRRDVGVALDQAKFPNSEVP